MINSVRQSVIDKLIELYPGNTIYIEDVPQQFKKPSFLINLIDQDYNKRMNIKFDSLLSFDIAYFSNEIDLKEDCQEVQLMLFRELDLVGSHRALNKQANTADNVLHVTFNINYSEITKEEYIKMMQAKVNERMEE